MAEKEEIRASLQKFLKNPNNAYTKVCTVIAVSAGPVDGLMICDCEPLDGTAIIEDVRLVANFTDSTTKAGFILVPKVDSLVLITFISPSVAYVSMVSEVDFVYLNGNLYGGLVKVSDLTLKLNNAENKINALITAINGWTPVPNDGGAALKVALTAWLASSLTPTVRADLENTKVNHGDGTLI